MFARRLTLCVASAAAALAGGRASAQQIGTTKQPLSVAQSLVWSGPIPVCWTAGTPDVAAQNLVRTAVASTWETQSGVRFIGWDVCPGYLTPGVRIRVADEKPRTLGLGRNLNGKAGGMVLNFTFQAWSPNCASTPAARTQCIRAIAVHEFGHAMGFAHEQNRPDATCEGQEQGATGDAVVGVWDLSSVMNYCNPRWNNGGTLSATDIQGARIYYGPPPSAIGAAPDGSYRQTCRNISADQSTLYASCPDRDDRMWRTSLTNVQRCTADIANSDGRLGCGGTLPTGSYLQTCRDAVADAGVLSATCRTTGLAFRRTSLAGYAACAGGIWNANGTLDCVKGGAAPAGSYRQKCTNVSVSGAGGTPTLIASCRDEDGASAVTTLVNFPLCRGDITNVDGLLQCPNGIPVPRGSYAQTCTNAFMNGTMLTAVCRSRSNARRKTLLPNAASCARDIGNVEGALVCSRND